MIESTGTKIGFTLCNKFSLRSLKENVGYKIKDVIPEKYEPKRFHTKKVWAKLKRKRVKQWVQRHSPERKKWVQKVSAGEVAHIS
jgi:hypothetical protein